MQPKARQVYFRRKNKTTYAIALKPSTTLRAVEILLAKREAIPPESIMLFHRGQPLPFTLQGLPSAGPECIVHVVDLDGVKRDTVSFSLRGLDGTSRLFSLSAATKVKDFVQQHLTRVDQLPHFYIGLVYLGKLLSPDHTLFEEFVEEGCEVVAVNLLALKGRGVAEKVELKGGRGAAAQQDGRLQSQNDHLGGQFANSPQIHPLHSKNQQPINAAADISADEVVGVKDKAEDVVVNEKIANFMSSQQQELPDMEEIPLYIQVSKVESVDSQDGQHNHVKFQHEEDPFDQTSTPAPPAPELLKERLGESYLTGEEFIVAGGGHESQTKSFIDRLMKKYKIMFE